MHAHYFLYLGKAYFHFDPGKKTSAAARQAAGAGHAKNTATATTKGRKDLCHTTAVVMACAGRAGRLCRIAGHGLYRIG